MLKLTETFDLTYSVKENSLIIVPCLLPDKEPEFDWPEIVKVENEMGNNNNMIVKIKEFQVVYTFAYIPAGKYNLGNF